MDTEKELKRAIFAFIHAQSKVLGACQGENIFNNLLEVVGNSVGELKVLFEPYSNAWNFWFNKEYEVKSLATKY